MAFMRSESFDWVGFGNTEAEAKEAIISEWNRFFCDDEDLGSIEYLISCTEVNPNVCFVIDKDSVSLK